MLDLLNLKQAGNIQSIKHCLTVTIGATIIATLLGSKDFDTMFMV